MCSNNSATSGVDYGPVTGLDVAIFEAHRDRRTGQIAQFDISGRRLLRWSLEHVQHHPVGFVAHLMLDEMVDISVFPAQRLHSARHHALHKADCFGTDFGHFHAETGLDTAFRGEDIVIIKARVARV